MFILNEDIYISKIKYNLEIMCKSSKLDDLDTKLIIDSIINLSTEYINRGDKDFIEKCKIRDSQTRTSVSSQLDDDIITKVWLIIITCYWIVMKYCNDTCNKIYMPFYNMNEINMMEIKILKYIDYRIYNYIKTYNDYN